ncbi:MAG TPA: hypothetical protein V6C65_41280, partial [Allocoleopsis sp.]
IVTNQARLVKTNAPLKSYIGGVSVGTVAVTSEATTLAVLCEGKKPGSAGGADGTQAFKEVQASVQADGTPICTALGDFEEIK